MMAIATSRKKKELPYLCFTANVDNSTVRLNKAGTGTFNSISLKYSVNNGKTWNDYEWGNDLSDPNLGTPISLAHAGDKVYFKATNGKSNNSFSTSNTHYIFKMTGSIDASGNIMSLVSDSMPNDIPSSYFFYNLFLNCTSLVTAPLLPATTLGINCYGHMFEGCSSLKFAPLLPATVGSRYAYFAMFKDCTNLQGIPEILVTNVSTVFKIMNYMFQGCSSLEGIKVHFTTWNSTNNTTDSWLPDNQGAVFHCPSTLDTSVERSTSTIPSNWTIKKEGYYYNDNFYDDAEHTTASTLIAGEYYIDIPTQDEYYYNGNSLVPWGRPLPNGYEQLDYIETDGNQFIDTQYLGQSANIEIVAKAKVLELPGTEQDFISNFNGSTSNNRITLGINAGNRWFLYSRNGYNTADPNSYINANLGQEFLITAQFDPSLQIKQLTVNDVSSNVVSYTCETASETITYKLMARGDSNNNLVNYGFIGRLYYLVLKEDGEVKLCFQPCHDTTNNVDGVYDLKRNAFYPLINVTT